MDEYKKFVIETYLNIRKAISEELVSPDSHTWKALIGSLNLAQIALNDNGITYEDIEAVKNS
jgi:hypothetical protein